MYFADLSPCTYNLGRNPSGLSVGWLDKNHAFSTGIVPDGLVEKLAKICVTPLILHRGFHLCEFCKFEQRSTDEFWNLARDAGALSSSVIQVISANAILYYSPGMICHYIAKHGYKPPEEFTKAAMETELYVKPLKVD